MALGSSHLETKAHRHHRQAVAHRVVAFFGMVPCFPAFERGNLGIGDAAPSDSCHCFNSLIFTLTSHAQSSVPAHQRSISNCWRMPPNRGSTKRKARSTASSCSNDGDASRVRLIAAHWHCRFMNVAINTSRHGPRFEIAKMKFGLIEAIELKLEWHKDYPKLAWSGPPLSLRQGGRRREYFDAHRALTGAGEAM
jgi:hypothetical protein